MPAVTAAPVTGYPLIGYMSMPEDFRYREAFYHGRPRHDSLSSFRMKHPAMPCFRRAKIFAPFDALKGFNEAVASKEVLYMGQPELSDHEKEVLDRKLSVLHRLTYTRKAARQNAPVITVTYFLPCSDEQNDAYGTSGTLETVTGICSRVDTQVTRTITTDGLTISLENVTDISGNIPGASFDNDCC